MNHHSLSNALTMTGNLLKNLKFQIFVHVVTDHAVRAMGASELMEEYMDASNFGVGVCFVLNLLVCVRFKQELKCLLFTRGTTSAVF